MNGSGAQFRKKLIVWVGGSPQVDLVTDIQVFQCVIRKILGGYPEPRPQFGPVSPLVTNEQIVTDRVPRSGNKGNKGFHSCGSSSLEAVLPSQRTEKSIDPSCEVAHAAPFGHPRRRSFLRP